MTYAPAIFDAAMTYGLGCNAFTRDIWFDLDPYHEALPSTSCDLCTCKVWSCYGKWLRRCITKKIHYLTLTLRSRESRSHKMLPSTLDIMWPMHQQSVMLLHPMVKKMHFQENNYLTLTLGSRSHTKGQGHTKCCPVPSTSCDLCNSKVKEKMNLQVNTLFDLDLRVKVTLNVAQCPLHHVTYAPTEFEVTTSKGWGGDAFTRKFNIWPLTLASRSHEMLPSTLYIVWLIQQQSLKMLWLDTFTRKYIIWPLTLGSRSHKKLPSALCIMCPIQLQSLKLLSLMV